jgi:desulfoferrodoxin-like iron-binding protein
MLGKIKKALNPKSKDEEKDAGNTGGLTDTGASDTQLGSTPSTSQGIGSTSPTSSTGDVSPSGTDPMSGVASSGINDPSDQPATGGLATPSTGGPSDLAKPVSPPAIPPEEEKKLEKKEAELKDSTLSGQDINEAAQAIGGAPQPTTPPIGGTPSQPEPLDDKSDISGSGVPAATQLPSATTEDSSGEPTSGASVPPQGESSSGDLTSSIPPIGQTATPGMNETPQSQTESPSVSPSPAGQTPSTAPGAAPAATSGNVADEELRKTHEPVIILPDRLEMGQMVSVKVKAGMIPHVMEADHYIQSIELFANDQSIGKVDLNPKDNKLAEAEFQIALSAGMKLKAVIYCNVHGKWEVEQDIGTTSMSAQ